MSSINNPKHNVVLMLILTLSFLPISLTASSILEIENLLEKKISINQNKTGIYILEKGQEALLGRAWLTDHAKVSIDVQYFIWSNDNVGVLAAEALLRAAERGVKVRVLVDDLLIKAEEQTLFALANHSNIDIRIYNPGHSVGTSKWKRFINLLTNFRKLNQRMHNKIAVFDGKFGITGGRNMADEYFDFNQEYSFRDRDILLVGNAVNEMGNMFEEYWGSSLSVDIQSLLDENSIDIQDSANRIILDDLHAYAQNPSNFEPEVRDALTDMTKNISYILGKLVWDDVEFISDRPGKNDGSDGLGGGGDITDILICEVEKAKKSIIIQSPYLVLTKGGFELFAKKIKEGVDVRIITNSLPSTDNLMAFSGYQKQKKALRNIGVDIYEYKPYPVAQKDLFQRFSEMSRNIPIFAIHAKTFVIDSNVLYVGTFNLDPRSANLNTEVGVLIRNSELAQQTENNILRDMAPENSWRVKDYNANSKAKLFKRFKLFLYKLLPLEPVL